MYTDSILDYNTSDHCYFFNKGILINAYMWKIDNLYGIPLIQIYKNTDTEWVIKVIKVYKSEFNGDTASDYGLNTKITIYYI